MDAIREQPDPVIACSDVCMDFETQDGRVQVLDGVDVSVSRGETVVITGRTGAGKSTLLSLLAGLDRPVSGTVLLEGRPMEELSGSERAAARRRRIGVLFQSFNLLPSWTALENVEAALLHTPLPMSERRAKAGALLASVGLQERLHHLPSELSVGQQQLVAVARALANEPALLVADEPTGDVDAETGRQLVDLLTAPVKARGAALVVATHGPFPLEAADRVLVLANGRISPRTPVREST